MVLGYSAVNPKCIKEIPENFHYYEPGLKLDKKNKNNKDRRKLKRNCKIFSKLKCIQISYKNILYDLMLGVSPVQRSVLRGNVNWDLKIVSLYRDVRYTEVLL